MNAGVRTIAPERHVGRPTSPSVHYAPFAGPFNYAAGAGPTRFTLSELVEIGVRRVTIGTSFARTALNAMLRAAREVLDHGTFGYLEGLPTVADFKRVVETG